MLLPALAKAHAVVCMNNLRQLQLTGIMYADDNNDTVVRNEPGDAGGGETDNWVHGRLGFAGSAPDNTNTILLTSAEMSLYSKQSVSIYNTSVRRTAAGRRDVIALSHRDW